MNPALMRLLVVDDSDSMRGAICDLLVSEGYQCIDEAADGTRAWELFRRRPYDVVITDWYMPHVSGLELLRAIRAGSHRPSTPVLVLTGEVSREHEHEALLAGATGFIGKPLFAVTLTNSLRLLA